MSLDISLYCKECGSELYEGNITHNLAPMAKFIGAYDAIWRPDENKIETARQMIPLLEKARKILFNNPDKCRELNPSNGWGSYETLADVIESYLRACSKYPKALVHVWR